MPSKCQISVLLRAIVWFVSLSYLHLTISIFFVFVILTSYYIRCIILGDMLRIIRVGRLDKLLKPDLAIPLRCYKWYYPLIVTYCLDVIEGASTVDADLVKVTP